MTFLPLVTDCCCSLECNDPPLAGLPARALGRGLFPRAAALRPWSSVLNEQYVWSQLCALSWAAWEVAVAQHAGRDALAPNLQAVQLVCSSYVSVGLSRAPGACVNGSQYLPACLVMPQDVECNHEMVLASAEYVGDAVLLAAQGAGVVQNLHAIVQHTKQKGLAYVPSLAGCAPSRPLA